MQVRSVGKGALFGLARRVVWSALACVVAVSALVIAGVLPGWRPGAVAGTGVPAPYRYRASSGGPVSHTATASQFSLLTEPTTGFSRIYALIDGARRSIDMVMYELADTNAEAALAQAAARGVRVQVLLDRDYHGGSVNRAAYAYLRSHGVAVRWGPATTIVHEKAIVVDKTVAAIGTGNLTANYYATTRDYWVLDTTRADVAAITATFGADWATGRIRAGRSGPDLVWSPGSEARLVSLITSARHSVAFESEELSDRAIVDALSADARRGVRCQVLMEAQATWDRVFSVLRHAGCTVRTYTTGVQALYIHAKAIVVDAGTPGARVFVGSENASVASLVYDRELGLVLSRHRAPVIVASVAATFAHDFAGGVAWR